MEILGAIIGILLLVGVAVVSTLIAFSRVCDNRGGVAGIGKQSKDIETGIDKQADVVRRNKESIDNIEKLVDGIGKSDSVTQDTIARTDSILQKIRTRPHTDNSDNK